MPGVDFNKLRNGSHDGRSAKPTWFSADEPVRTTSYTGHAQFMAQRQQEADRFRSTWMKDDTTATNVTAKETS